MKSTEEILEYIKPRIIWCGPQYDDDFEPYHHIKLKDNTLYKTSDYINDRFGFIDGIELYRVIVLLDVHRLMNLQSIPVI